LYRIINVITHEGIMRSVNTPPIFIHVECTSLTKRSVKEYISDLITDRFHAELVIYNHPDFHSMDMISAMVLQID
jgi:hypothetical protein